MRSSSHDDEAVLPSDGVGEQRALA